MRCRTAGVANFALLVSFWLSRSTHEDSAEDGVLTAVVSTLPDSDDDDSDDVVDNSDDGGDVREDPDPSSGASSAPTPISGPVKLASLGSMSL